MPLFSDATYEALLYVAKNKCQNETIDWQAESIENHCIEKYGQEEKNCFSVRGNEAFRKRRQLFLRRAIKYTSSNGKLIKDGKPVLRRDDYQEVLERWHDKDGHAGQKKLRIKVITHVTVYLDLFSA